MDATASGLILCLLGAILARRDIRSALRRLTWARAEATLRYSPAEAGPSWVIAFHLPDGRAVRFVTRDLRMVARREADAPVRVLYDPRAPDRAVEIPARPGLGLVVGAGLVLLGLAQVLR